MTIHIGQTVRIFERFRGRYAAATVTRMPAEGYVQVKTDRGNLEYRLISELSEWSY